MSDTPGQFFDEIIVDEINWLGKFSDNAIEDFIWLLKEPSIDFATDVLISFTIVALQLLVLSLAFIYLASTLIVFIPFLLKDIFNQLINILINLRKSYK